MSVSSANQTNSLHQAYILLKKKRVKEVNADCFLFEHIKSGARVFKIMADDPNNTFSIAFKTIPDSDAGAPHIMEHSVLNGSKNFSVKSPFDVLSKGSLHTFLNAMTYPDFTIYPVASINKTDYFNLMHVYLDAVFNPNLYSDPRIFMQEGWHYELVSRDSQLEYKGVVYNEMKGAFSNPERELWYLIQKNLFPANGYQFASGGYPPAIPSLTYHDFVRFHKEHYHPSNSYIFLFGNAGLEEELTFIDREYLSRFNKIRIENLKPINPPFQNLKKLKGYYPVTENISEENQSFLSLSWVIGLGSDQMTVMALDILADVLVNQESGPVREALQEAGIGKEVYSHAQNMMQNTLSIVVQNAKGTDADAFRSVVMSTLQKLVTGKIDRDSLQGSLNRMEFRLREGDDAQKGITFILRSMTGWMFTDDPFPSLEYESLLDQIRNSLDGNYFESRIQKDLIGNPHGLLLTLEPKAGLEKKNALKIAKNLEDQKKRLSPDELDDLIGKTRELIDYQKMEDSPEALATIPVLKLSDISPEAAWYGIDEYNIGGIRLLHHRQFTNKIIYMNCWFDLRIFSQDLVPYIALFSELLGKMDTKNYSYKGLDKALNINTGGFNTTVTSLLPDYDDEKMLPQFRIRMKTTVDKLDVSLSLLKEMLTGTQLNDKNRLGELLKRIHSQVESSVKHNGYGITLTRLESYYSRRGAFNDMTHGMEYYWFITGMLKQYESDPDSIVERLTNIRDKLFNRENMIAGVTCSEEDFNICNLSLPSLLSSLPVGKIARYNWTLTPIIKNEGIKTASKVQYILQGYDFRKLGYTWNGKWNVLSQVLSTDWLQNRIRVIGGAYGGFSGISRNGTIYLSSYRDPNLKETFDNFRDTVDYLAGFRADATAMSRYIIGTIAHLDNLLTPSEKGEVGFRRFMENTSRGDIQKDRDSVLATTADDIRNMSGLIAKVLDQNVICVYGNEEKLNANKNLFGSLVMLQN